MKDDAERFEDALLKLTQALIIEGNFGSTIAASDSVLKRAEDSALNHASALAVRIMAETDRRYPRTN